MSVPGTLAIALAGVACSMVLDLWLPSWMASLSGLALVLGLLAMRRRAAARDRTDGDR